MNNSFFVVLMAGGSGTRLWPMSRKKMPKQFHKIAGERSLLQATYDRFHEIVPDENIFISAVSGIEEIIKKQLPKIPNENFILEPEAKNTGPATALIAAKIFKKNPQAVVAAISTDHTISKVSNYQRAIISAVNFVKENPEYLVTIGIKPTHPDTGYGYIKFGRKFQSSPLHIGEGFVEKPNLETAEKYLKSGDYLWNASYFFWRADKLLEMYKMSSKNYADFIDKFLGEKNFDLYKEYDKLKVEPFDTVIAEKAENLAVYPADLGWSDVGSWATLYNFMPVNKKGIVSKGNHVGVDDKNCLVYAGGKLLATIGLENIVVVDTEDATLICNKDKTQDVKLLLEELKSKGLDKYL